MSESPHLLVERTDHIVTLTFNRPESKNAFDLEVLVRLWDAWKMIDEDPEIRCAILTGAGGDFCAGSDLKQMHGNNEGNPWFERFKEDPDLHWKAMLRHYSLKKPLISAVEGTALAGGTEFLLATDIRVVFGEGHQFVTDRSEATDDLLEARHRAVVIVEEDVQSSSQAVRFDVQSGVLDDEKQRVDRGQCFVVLLRLDVGPAHLVERHLELGAGTRNTLVAEGCRLEVALLHVDSTNGQHRQVPQVDVLGPFEPREDVELGPSLIVPLERRVGRSEVVSSVVFKCVVVEQLGQSVDRALVPSEPNQCLAVGVAGLGAPY